MLGKYVAVLRRRLTTGSEEDEPLNKLSIAIIILLDLFVLNLLFYGLADHTKQITSPDEYMPYVARQAFIDEMWTPATRLNNLQTLILSDRKNYRYRDDSIFEEGRLKQMHPLCREFYERIKTLSEDKGLYERFVERERYAQELGKLIENQDKTKRAYDTQLLESIAGKAESTGSAIATRSGNLTAQIEQLTTRIAEIEKQINAHAGVRGLWAMVAPENEKRVQVINDFRRYDRWYPLKEFAWQLVFLLPILLIFLAWSRWSARRDKWIQTLVSSHLLVVSFLPILFKLIEVVVDLIPNHFFKNLFNILKSLRLIAIWHYLVIVGAVAVGLLLVFLIQKKIFSKQRTMQKRLARGACRRCGKKLPTGASTCPYCGIQQLTPCGICQKPTPVAGSFCIHCGATVSEQ